LKAAWPSIKVLGEKLGFDEAWQRLIVHLGELDEYLHKS